MTLSWKYIEDRVIEFDVLMQYGVKTAELKTLQPSVAKWVQHTKCRPEHALHMLPWGANPFTDLGGDLADVISLKANSKQLRQMGVTYKQLCDNGMTAETMRLMSLSLQSWIDLGFTYADMSDMTDAQLAKVFNMLRLNLASCFKQQ